MHSDDSAQPNGRGITRRSAIKHGLLLGTTLLVGPGKGSAQSAPASEWFDLGWEDVAALKRRKTM
jgi:hypothetical protein